MNETIHPFDTLIALEKKAPDLYTAKPSVAYQNIVGPFGGATAAQLLAAVMKSETYAGTPVAVTTNFLAPIESESFHISVRKTRQNFTTQHWLVELSQGSGEELKANATIVTATRRSTWRETELRSPQVASVDSILAMPREPKGKWFDRYDFRFADGDYPQFATGEEKPDSRTTAWLRDRSYRALDFPSLLAMSDAYFPRIFIRKPKFVPMGTVSMTTYFHCMEADLSRVGDAYILATAQANVFNAGFFDHAGSLWSQDGQCLATTQQVVYFKD